MPSAAIEPVKPLTVHLPFELFTRIEALREREKLHSAAVFADKQSYITRDKLAHALKIYRRFLQRNEEAGEAYAARQVAFYFKGQCTTRSAPRNVNLRNLITALLELALKAAENMPSVLDPSADSEYLTLEQVMLELRK